MLVVRGLTSTLRRRCSPPFCPRAVPGSVPDSPQFGSTEVQAAEGKESQSVCQRPAGKEKKKKIFHVCKRFHSGMELSKLPSVAL